MCPARPSAGLVGWAWTRGARVCECVPQGRESGHREAPPSFRDALGFRVWPGLRICCRSAVACECLVRRTERPRGRASAMDPRVGPARAPPPCWRCRAPEGPPRCRAAPITRGCAPGDNTLGVHQPIPGGDEKVRYKNNAYVRQPVHLQSTLLPKEKHATMKCLHANLIKSTLRSWTRPRRRRGARTACV